MSAFAWNWFRWRHSTGLGFVPYHQLRQPYQQHQQAKWKTSTAGYVVSSASSIIRYRLWRIWAAPARRFFPITSSANSWRGAPDCLLSDISSPNNPRNCLPFTRRVGSKRKEVFQNHQRNSTRMCSHVFSLVFASNKKLLTYAWSDSRGGPQALFCFSSHGEARELETINKRARNAKAYVTAEKVCRVHVAKW